jgi:uncharacterized protein
MSRYPRSPERSKALRRRRARVLFAMALLLGAMFGPAARALESLDEFPQSALEIRTAAGQQRFNVWIADTPARSEQGLMFVRALPANYGMLFPRDRPGVFRMWMKNTRIALDMLFIDTHGQIIYIYRNAKPESQAIITTPTPVITPVKAVLELAGGECARRHIEQGDRVIHELFD